MSSKRSVKKFSFISYFLFSHNPCNRCEIPDNDFDDKKINLKVEDGEEKEDEEENLEVSDEDIDGTNDDEEEDRSKNTKEVMPKYLSFVKGVVDSNDFLPLNVNRETLHESKIIRIISNNLVREAIYMLHKLVEKDEFKEKKDDGIDDETKEVEINYNG